MCEKKQITHWSPQIKHHRVNTPTDLIQALHTQILIDITSVLMYSFITIYILPLKHLWVTCYCLRHPFKGLYKNPWYVCCRLFTVHLCSAGAADRKDRIFSVCLRCCMLMMNCRNMIYDFHNRLYMFKCFKDVSFFPLFTSTAPVDLVVAPHFIQY